MDVVMRPLDGDDLPTVVELMNTSGRADGSTEVMTLAELADELDDERVVLATDTRAALLDDRIVATAYTYLLPSDVRELRCYIFGTVHPDHRRQGLGTALMKWAVARATEQLGPGDPALPRHIRTDVGEGLVGALALFDSLGMQRVRVHETLRRPLDTAPEPVEPPGVRIVPWPTERNDDIREAKNAAFADHWGSTPTSPADWHTTTHGHGARLDLSFVALDHDDEIVGHCLNKRFPDDDDVTGRRDGWIENLGTRRDWRGRGVATSLVTRTLTAFRAVDLTHACIGVDADNPTGAARLYRSLGFEPVERSITSQLTL